MKKLINLFRVLSLVIFISCDNVSKIDDIDYYLITPFNKNDTSIFYSEDGRIDTIVFYKAEIDTFKVRHISRGFYNELQIAVRYKVLNRNNHYFPSIDELEQSVGQNNIMDSKDEVKIGKNLRAKIKIQCVDENLIQVTKSNNISDYNVNFLGLYFNDGSVNNIIELNDDSLIFRSKEATDTNLNINQGIAQFVFDKNSGIISYTDSKGQMWKRKKHRI